MYPKRFDEDYLNRNAFIIKKHQTDARYFTCISDVVFLLYQMGSGKTFSMLYAIKDYITTISNARNNYKKLNGIDLPTKIVLVGSWTTRDALYKDIRQPILRIIDLSTDQIDIDKEITSNIKYYGYKSFTNAVLPNALYIDDPDELATSDKVKMNESIFEQLRNSIIIVDEFQSLYSLNGINTYGAALERLMRYRNKYNFKLIMLSGTPINTSSAELVYLYNIIREPNTERMNLEKAIINKDFLGSTLQIINGDYSNNVLDTLIKYSLHYETETGSKKDYPEEIQVGNCKLNIINLQVLELKGYQLDEYKKRIENNIEVQNEVMRIDVNDDDNNVHIFDAYIPPKEELAKHKIILDHDLYTGEFLNKKNIGEYSAIGEYVLKHVDSCMCKGEKSAIYHDKLRGFGLLQYAQILCSNGYMRYGSRPTSFIRCWVCGEIMANHTSIKTHEYKPATIAVLTGDLQRAQRTDIINTYNDPRNTNGELICTLFISRVAYAGLTLQSTNHMLILSRISNISKWKQICKRIIRLKSHNLKPEDKRWGKIYTLVVRDKEEVEPLMIRYYKIRELLNDDLNKYINQIYDKCNNKDIYSDPRVKLIYNHDVYNSINILASTYLSDYNYWNVSSIIKMLKTPKYNRSNLIIDLPDDKLAQIIHSHEYYDKQLDALYIKPIVHVRVQYPKIYFDNFAKFESMDDKQIFNEIDTFLQSNNNSIRSYEIFMSNIFRYVNGNIHRLIPCESFWKIIYLLHDEYYDGDKDFITYIQNHRSENRSYDKVDGMYYMGHIYKKDGTRIDINTTIINNISIYNGYILQLAHGTSKSDWSISLKFISRESNDIIDKRRQSRGIECISTIDKIADMFHIEKSSSKKLACLEMITEVCNIQYNELVQGNGDKLLLTPFEII